MSKNVNNDVRVNPPIRNALTDRSFFFYTGTNLARIFQTKLVFLQPKVMCPLIYVTTPLLRRTGRTLRRMSQNSGK